MNKHMESNQYMKIYALIVVGTALVAALIFYKKTRTNVNEGWKTTKELNKPFQQSILLNGLSPAAFEIVLVQPINDVFAKTGVDNTIDIRAQVKFPDLVAVNNDIAPTKVTAHIQRNKTQIISKLLDPFAREKLTYIYKGVIDLPKNPGHYRLFIEVAYSIHGDRADEHVKEGMSVMKPLKSFKKTLEGVMIHVGN